jgi:hypothetical protein
VKVSAVDLVGVADGDGREVNGVTVALKICSILKQVSCFKSRPGKLTAIISADFRRVSMAD